MKIKAEEYYCICSFKQERHSEHCPVAHFSMGEKERMINQINTEDTRTLAGKYQVTMGVAVSALRAAESDPIKAEEIIRAKLRKPSAVMDILGYNGGR